MPVELFDANYYRSVNPDLANFDEAQARSHFQNYGLAEGRQFSPLVNLNFYRSNNSDLAIAGLTTNSQLFDHLQNDGISEGRRFSPLVDLEFYRYNNPDLTLLSSQGDSLLFEHLQKNGLTEGRQFSPFFDVNYYLSNNPDLVTAGLNNKQAFEHFQESGIAEGRHASVLVLFDPGYYLSQNRQLVAAGINNNQKAFEHFQSYGYAEGRRSSPLFDRNGIEALVGYSPARWNVSQGGTLTFSFVTAASASSYIGPETGVGELSVAIKNNIRNILYNLYTPILPFNLVEVPDTDASHGQIRLMFSNGNGVPSFYAYTYELGFDDLDGDVHLSRDAEGSSINAFSGGPGTYGYASLIHEIGHAFGLKHPGNYNGKRSAGQPPFLPYGEDNNMNTVMTYNYSLSDPSPSTPMAYDIRALQYLYGANNFNNSDTIYKFDRSNFINQSQTIWDSGGIDILDFSALSPNETYYYFDMNEGGHLTTGDARNAGSYSALGDRTFATYRPDRYATAIAYGTIMENLNGSQGNDYIIGNQADNLIRGEAGYDILVGGAGADTLVGGGDGDTFVLTPGGGAADLIMDFVDGQDRLNLQGGLTPNSLTFTQGTGDNGNNTFVQIPGSGELLAVLVGVNASAIASPDFTSI
ncbi:M10 family metallopeptidase C-terminal domain-containing protein [Argonema galeatum]|uniref:M10 family metallopeptidase C-terminal domain-containing protein n=1 Tax=Argonema galeatum TaxID=2942762 RepID=UPI002012C6FD|nr:M10 family metallopeptidase C-terminal domain-containing protein [Argonema galeatum]MCL1468209.1 M10 family metallopeptidase C-terminal domain-containing protein [Argonema galeatum A003/A1]